MGVAETGVELPLRAPLRVKARVFRNKVENCRLAYGPQTSVPSLFNCCPRWVIRLIEAEKMGSWVQTEANKPTTREERYGGGGAVGVIPSVFGNTQ